MTGTDLHNCPRRQADPQPNMPEIRCSCSVTAARALGYALVFALAVALVTYFIADDFDSHILTTCDVTSFGVDDCDYDRTQVPVNTDPGPNFDGCYVTVTCDARWNVTYPVKQTVGDTVTEMLFRSRIVQPESQTDRYISSLCDRKDELHSVVRQNTDALVISLYSKYKNDVGRMEPCYWLDDEPSRATWDDHDISTFVIVVMVMAGIGCVTGVVFSIRRAAAYISGRGMGPDTYITFGTERRGANQPLATVAEYGTDRT